MSTVKKKKSPVKAPKTTEVNISQLAAVDESHKLLLEAASGKKLNKDEWASVRQCIRCLTQGKRIYKSKKEGGRPVIRDGSELVASTIDACRQIIEQANKKKMGILEAARALTIVS